MNDYKDKKKIYNFYLTMSNKGILNDVNFTYGGNCVARNKKSELLTYDAKSYQCYAFVGTKWWNNINERNINNFALEDCAENCHLFNYCKGGCVYSNYCDSGVIKNICYKQDLDDINKYLFLLNLNYRNKISISDFEKEQKNVETISIDI